MGAGLHRVLDRRRMRGVRVNFRARQDAVWAKSNGLCWYCGIELVAGLSDEERPQEPRYFHIDHINPRCLGGTDDFSNLAPCCAACNLQKSGMELEAFRWRMTKRACDMPSFTAEQHEWLRRHGFDAFEMVPVYVFWFEQFPRIAA